MRVGLLILAMFGSTEAFAVASSRAALQQARSSTPAMQFFNPKKDGADAIKKRQSREFYDDEKDTTAKPMWNALQEEKRANRGYRSPQEAAGFGENGEDLANTGGALYLATVPFLLFAISYIFGGIGSPYSSGGNF